MRSSRLSRNNIPFINFLMDWVIPVLIAVIAAHLLTKYVLFKVVIPSESMYPTLTNKDQIFVTKIYNYDKIKRGDILVFNFNEDGKDTTLIKRVIGLPGDTVDVSANGDVYVNGEKLDEPYINQEGAKATKSGYFEVPDGEYLFLGDNRNDSYDSRLWQYPYIEQDEIIAKARLRVYPFSRIRLFN